MLDLKQDYFLGYKILKYKFVMLSIVFELIKIALLIYLIL